MAEFNEEHSYALAMEGIKDLGTCGASICTAFSSLGAEAFKASGQVVDSVFKPITNAINTYRAVKIQRLQNDLKVMEMSHEEKMQKLQNKHEEKMLAEQNRHEEFIISEQRKVIEKMIEAATVAYEKKVDFLNAQLNCLEQTYSKERDLISEHIQYLEKERNQSFDDADKYMQLSDDLNKLEDQKSKLYTEYMAAQGNLNDAIKYLEIDKAYNSSLEKMQTNLSVEDK